MARAATAASALEGWRTAAAAAAALVVVEVTSMLA